jgi:hypothetical protein
MRQNQDVINADVSGSGKEATAAAGASRFSTRVSTRDTAKTVGEEVAGFVRISWLIERDWAVLAHRTADIPSAKTCSIVILNC